MKTETPKIFRIITQSEGVTMTAQTARAVTQQEASQIAEKDLIPPNVKLQNYILQPICTERQWKYGQINFCPRCGKNICEDPEIGGEDDRWVNNSQEFECPECYAEIWVEIKSTEEERDDAEGEMIG